MKQIFVTPKRWKKKVIYLFFVFLMLCGTGFNFPAQAQITHNIGTQGDLIIPGTSTDDYIITGTTTANAVVVGSGYQGTITLSNLNMLSSRHPGFTDFGSTGLSGYSCITVEGQNGLDTNLAPVTKVNFVLEGANILRYESPVSYGYYCALQVNQGAQIHISAIDPCDNTSGTLHASVKQTSFDGAAIGGPTAGAYNGSYDPNGGQGPAVVTCNSGSSLIHYTTGGNVIISSGNVTAQGGHSAGIGGPRVGYYDGIIMILGGNVTASSGTHAAGIGSGCVLNTGVIDCYTQNSTILVLPPAIVEATGSPADKSIGGTRFVTYVNDPAKPEVVIRTSDNLTDANIFIDITGDAQLMSTLSQIYPEFEADKIWLGRTDASGSLSLHAYFQNAVRFYTDAHSSDGRFYTGVTTSTVESGTNSDIILSLESDLGIAFTSDASIPLCEGYTSGQAQTHAFRAKIENTTGAAISVSNWTMQNTTDFGINFYNESGVPIATPTSIAAGQSVYVSLPIVAGKVAGLYEDRLTATVSGVNRPVLHILQRVGCQISDITTVATPPSFSELYPTNREVTLSITMTLPNPEINCFSTVSFTNYAYFLVSENSNFESALALSDRSDWVLLPITETGDPVDNTQTPFTDKPAGTYSIHWFGESGNEGGSGTFGPYIIDDITYNVTYSGNGNTSGTPPADPNLYREGDPVTLLAPGTIARTCHTFLGWATSSTATTPNYVYNPGTYTFTPSTFNITQNTTLYAVWRNETVTTTFSLNSSYTYCQGETSVVTLPTTSTNGITGTWSPYTAINTSTSGTRTYTFTPTAGVCATTRSISVTVNPRPSITNIAQTICSGGTFTATPVNSTNGTVPSGTRYTWTVSPASSPTGVSGQSIGTNLTAISQTLTNHTNAPVNVVYTVTPTSSSCAGNPFTVTITVYPSVSDINDITRTICSGETFTATPENGSDGVVPTSGMTYNWTVLPISSVSSVSGQSAGSNQTTISQTLRNHTNAAVDVIYTVIPTFTNGITSCTGDSFTVIVTVDPVPEVVPKRIQD